MKEDELEVMVDAYERLMVAIEWLLTLGVPEEHHVEMERMIRTRNRLANSSGLTTRRKGKGGSRVIH